LTTSTSIDYAGERQMGTRTVEDRVIDVVAEQLGVAREKITLDSSLRSLGVDSLDTTELILELEEEFSVTIRDELAEEIRTVAQAIDCIRSLPYDQ